MLQRIPESLIPMAILSGLLLLPSCPQDGQHDERIVQVERIKVAEVDPAEQPGEFDPQHPVGDPIGDELPERQLGQFVTVIPQGTTQWPNGEPFPPEFLEILRKLESGESISGDDVITFRAFDSKWRNWERIEEIGNSQQD